jgi:hypothetical protein
VPSTVPVKSRSRRHRRRLLHLEGHPELLRPAFPDLGMEAICEFDVVNTPVTVAVDSRGTSIHQAGLAEWQAAQTNPYPAPYLATAPGRPRCSASLARPAWCSSQPALHPAQAAASPGLRALNTEPVWRWACPASAPHGADRRLVWCRPSTYRRRCSRAGKPSCTCLLTSSPGCVGTPHPSSC